MKTTKISLSILFFILAIIMIAIMAIFMYKFYNEKIEANAKVTELQSYVNNLNETVNSLQGKINDISDDIEFNNSTEDTTITDNNSMSFTEDQIKTAVSNYLELQAHACCNDLLENLTEKGKLNYDPSKDTLLEDGKVITTIKFSDYKNAMLNYVSESDFEDNWIVTEKIIYRDNDDGYVTTVQGGGDFPVYSINSITKISDLTYLAKATATYEILDTKEDEQFIFKITSYNGNCVIDYLK